MKNGGTVDIWSQVSLCCGGSVGCLPASLTSIPTIRVTTIKIHSRHWQTFRWGQNHPWLRTTDVREILVLVRKAFLWHSPWSWFQEWTHNTSFALRKWEGKFSGSCKEKFLCSQKRTPSWVGWLFLFWTSVCVDVKSGSTTALLHPPDPDRGVHLEPLDWAMSGHCPAPYFPVTWTHSLPSNLTQHEWGFLLLAARDFQPTQQLWQDQF